jgi:drug/metabolite transporter (DMT)-like permease
MNKETRGALLTLAGGICWGLSGSMGQYLFQHEGMDSRWLVPIRLGLAGIILLAFSIRRSGRKVLDPWRTREDRRDLLIYGIAGVSCCQFLYFLTIQLSTAGIATILQDLSPVMILLATCFLQHRRATGRELLSILLALAGVFLITTHGRIGQVAVPPAALLTGILCAGCVTIYNIQPRRLLSRYPVALLQGWAFLLGSLLFLLIFHPWTFRYVPSAMGWIGIAFVVLVGNVFAFTAYMTGVSLIGPNKAILYGFSEPVTAAIVTVFLMSSPFTIYDALGFAAVFCMLAIISAKKPEAN